MWSVSYQMASVPIKDAELKTLVKRGAWYSENVDNSVLFGAGWRTTMVGSGSKRGGASTASWASMRPRPSSSTPRGCASKQP